VACHCIQHHASVICSLGHFGTVPRGISEYDHWAISVISGHVLTSILGRKREGRLPRSYAKAKHFCTECRPLRPLRVQPRLILAARGSDPVKIFVLESASSRFGPIQSSSCSTRWAGVPYRVRPWFALDLGIPNRNCWLFQDIFQLFRPCFNHICTIFHHIRPYSQRPFPM
jgi:hypothetical protein